MHSAVLRALAALAFMAYAVSPAAAQSYPSKSVRLIIPFPPGGSNDVVGRMFGQQLGERLGQALVVDNRGGAGSIIGTEAAAKAPADGYTLLLVSVPFAFAPAMYKNIPYDPARAFAPIGLIGSGPVVLVVHPGMPVNSVKDLIAVAKEKPYGVRVASAGIGSFQHLAIELFRLHSGVSLLHVPYKGGGPAMADVIGGHAEVLMGATVQILPHVRAGRLRALGVSGTRRNPALPDVPAIAESLPGYDATNWWGIMAPAGTPTPVIDRLHTDIGSVVVSAETRQRLEAEGAEAMPMSPAEFGKFIEAEIAKWSRVVKEAGITAD